MGTIIVLVPHIKNYFDVYRMFISYEPRIGFEYGTTALFGIGGYIDITNFALKKTLRYFTIPPSLDDLKFDLEFGMGANFLLFGATLSQLMGN